jgi:hypothetical protein
MGIVGQLSARAILVGIVSIISIACACAESRRVVLYDEDPSAPNGKQYIGQAVWRNVFVKEADGTSDIAIRADIDIPDRKLKATFTVRRNNDPFLPASHTVELTFDLPRDFEGGGISNIPGVLLKVNEQARGLPLAGVAVKVTEGLFLFGLSDVEADRERNLQLLTDHRWFDIPLYYADQRRAIIALEKGPSSEGAFADAFAAWKQ